MADKSNKQLIQELHQGIYGVPGTEDKGMIGDMKDLVVTVKKQNARIGKTENGISKLKGILIGVGILGGGGTGIGLWQIFGG